MVSQIHFPWSDSNVFAANAEVVTTWEECAMWMREWEHGKLTRSGDPEDWVEAAYDWEDMMVPSSWQVRCIMCTSPLVLSG